MKHSLTGLYAHEILDSRRIRTASQTPFSYMFP